MLTPIILIAGMIIYESIPIVAARKILLHANLSPLPDSYYEINAWHWSSLFSGEEFLKFRASPEDIESFLSSSPILKDKIYELYSIERMRIPYPDKYGTEEEHFNTPHEYYYPSPSAPDWYIEQLKGPGRRYEIHPEDYYYPGEVIIDDESGTVFVKLVFS